MKITEAYLETQRAMHARPEGYGGKGDRHAPYVHQLARYMAEEGTVNSILDYGAGQGKLQLALGARGLRCRSYDPAVEMFAGAPEPADLVVCTDVLEHVEPACIDSVLRHIDLLTMRTLFVVIALEPAGKTLPDGRNAHILLKPAGWWLNALGELFDPAPHHYADAIPPVSEKHYAGIWSAR